MLRTIAASLRRINRLGQKIWNYFPSQKTRALELSGAAIMMESPLGFGGFAPGSPMAPGQADLLLLGNDIPSGTGIAVLEHLSRASAGRPWRGKTAWSAMALFRYPDVSQGVSPAYIGEKQFPFVDGIDVPAKVVRCGDEEVVRCYFFRAARV